MFYIQLNAPLTKNGNPRRLFILTSESGEILKVVDSGFVGKPRDSNPVAFQIKIGVSEYRGWVKGAKREGNFYAN